MGDRQKMKAEEQIEVYGARVHNLKNIDVNIPRNSLTVITGLSGSGKSSLAFDTIFAEGQRRYSISFGCCLQGQGKHTLIYRGKKWFVIPRRKSFL